MTRHVVPPSLVETLPDPPASVTLPLLESKGGATIPDGLRGALYVNTAHGFGGALAQLGEPCITGDGRVYRVWFGGAEPTAEAKYVGDPTRHAEELAKADSRVQPFLPFGISRISPSDGTKRGLGVRNLANTAVVPVRVPGGKASSWPVLLATYDGGRPVALCPKTLRTLGVVGKVLRDANPPGAADGWQPQLFRDRPFPFYGATAHPTWSAGRLRAINFGRPLRRMAELGLRPAGEPRGPERRAYPIELFVALARGEALSVFTERLSTREAADALAAKLSAIAATLDPGIGALERRGDLVIDEEAGTARLPVGWRSETRDMVLELSVPALRALVTTDDRSGKTVLERILEGAALLFRELAGATADGFTRLVTWTPSATGANDFVSVPVVHLDDHGAEVPVTLLCSAHQLGESAHWVVFADCAFKFDFDILLPEQDLPGGETEETRTWMRRLLSRTQPARTALYFVPKAELDATPPPQKVVAHRVELDAEIVHFFVDWNDGTTGNEVRLWAIDQRATDTAEFVHSYDRGHDDERVDERPPRTPSELGRDIVGMFSAGYDVNEVHRYSIDPTTRSATRTGRAFDVERTWMLGLPAAPETVLLGPAPGTIDTVFVYSMGFLPEVVTRLGYGMYRQRRRDRLGGPTGAHVSTEDLRQLSCDDGVPGALLALGQDANGQLEIKHAFRCPPGLVLLTPQHVPHASDPSKPGFLLVPAYRATPVGLDQKTRELWVFRADDLSRPIRRYDATALGWRFALHTTWLSAADAEAEVTEPLPCLRRSLELDDARQPIEANHPEWPIYHEAIAKTLGTPRASARPPRSSEKRGSSKRPASTRGRRSGSRSKKR